MTLFTFLWVALRIIRAIFFRSKASASAKLNSPVSALVKRKSSEFTKVLALLNLLRLKLSFSSSRRDVTDTTFSFWFYAVSFQPLHLRGLLDFVIPHTT